MITSESTAPDKTSYSTDAPPKRVRRSFVILLFLLHVVGFCAYRQTMAPEIFGGDTVNLTLFRMTAYHLRMTDVVNPGDFASRLLESKDSSADSDIEPFIYQRMSSEGHNALQILSHNAGDSGALALLIHELNTSIIDSIAQWPETLNIPESNLWAKIRKDAGQPEFNLEVLVHFFPENIRPQRFPGDTVISLLKNLPVVASYYFTVREPTRYAPLTAIYTHELQLYLLANPDMVWVVILLTAILMAGLATTTFLFAFRFTLSIKWSLMAMLLFEASTSTILASYPLFSLPYLLVPLVFVMAFYGYMNYKDTGSWSSLLLYVICGIIGPWFREFPGAIPYIILASEILTYKGKRSNVILACTIPLMLHALYPSFITWLIGINKGNFYGVHEQQNTIAQSGGIRFNRTSSGFLFVQYSVIIWSLCWLSMVNFWKYHTTNPGSANLFTISIFKKVISVRKPSSEKARKWITYLPIGLVALTAFLSIYYFYMEYPNNPSPFRIRHGITLLLAVAAVPLFAIRFHPIIPLYFAATFLPFLKLRLAELHISFVMIPVSVAAALWIQSLWNDMRLRRGIKALARRSLAAVLTAFLLLALADQAVNLIAAWKAQRGLYKENKAMAGWLKNNLPRHSIIIFNMYHLTDVFYYSGRHFEPYDSVMSSPLPPAHIIDSDDQMRSLIQDNNSFRSIYLLEATHEEFPWEKGYFHHKWVENPPGDVELVKQFHTEVAFPYLDPFKGFVPRFFVSFPGYMDWESYFYFNNEGAFRRVIKADYSLFQLKNGRNLTLAESSS